MNLSILITSLFMAAIFPNQGQENIVAPVQPEISYSNSSSTDQTATTTAPLQEVPINKPDKKPTTAAKDSKLKKVGLDKAHPIVYKAGTPVRLCWHGVQKVGHACSETVIKIGKKSEPYLPFMSLCGALGNIATPFSAHFVSK
jgi:hypothetical protein